MENERLIELMAAYIESQPKQDPNWLRASGLGKCRRALAYTKLVPELSAPIKARGLLTFEFGHMIEELYAGILEKIRVLTDRQKEVSLELSNSVITGHIDGVLTLGDVRYVLDIKSCNTRKFSELKKSGAAALDRTYLVQLNIYMRALGILKGKFMFVNKDTNMDICHIIDIDYDPAIIDYVEAAVERVSGSGMDTLPDREYAPDAKTGNLPWQCTYCGYCSVCWGKSEPTGFNAKGKPVYKIGGDND